MGSAFGRGFKPLHLHTAKKGDSKQLQAVALLFFYVCGMAR